MAEEDAPKSAYELILERLKKKDREDGVLERSVTDEQRARLDFGIVHFTIDRQPNGVLHDTNRMPAGSGIRSRRSKSP